MRSVRNVCVAWLALYGSVLLVAGTGPVAVNRRAPREVAATLDVSAFIRAVEDDGMAADEARRVFLEGRSHKELFSAVLGSTAALAPAAVRVAAGGGTCARASDGAVRRLLKVHQDSCSATKNFRLNVNIAILQGNIQPPEDYTRKCGPRCSARFQAALEPLIEKFNARGGDAVRIAESDKVFIDMCSPILEAIVESCGQRQDVDAVSLAKEHASVGNLDVILKMRSNGYDVLGAPGSGGEHNCAVGSMLVRFGHVEKARLLVDAFPEFGAMVDCYGMDTHAFLDAHEMPVTALPGHMTGFKAPPPSTVGPGRGVEGAVAASYGDGGWPTVELAFPGGAEDGACEIAQLDGASVANDPTVFLSEFVLKRRPAILRDYVQHDNVIFVVSVTCSVCLMRACRCF